MRRILRVGVAMLGLGVSHAWAAPESPEGLWLSEDRSGVIAIERCDMGLCGRIAGIVLDHPTDATPTDYTGRSQCGLTIISRVLQSGDEWSARIVDPRNGKVYRALLQVDPQRRLRVRGYILTPLLGETQVWTSYGRAVPDDCRLSAP